MFARVRKPTVSKPPARQIRASQFQQTGIKISPNHFSTAANNGRPKIYVVYYSLYGHVHKLAQGIEEGARKVPDVDVKLFQVPETLNDDILKLVKAPPKPDVPVISVPQLLEADAFAFGFPTRFGMMASQFKAFLDGTGGLWAKQSLAGKMFTLFTSTGTQNGGQETTLLTAVTQVVHHGGILVPIGYTTPLMVEMDQIKGGSPYGAGTFAGPTGARQVTKIEYDIAVHQGELFAKTVRDYYRGKNLNK